MKIKLTREIKIGIFFLSILVTIFAVLNFLRGQDVFKNSYSYYAEYDDVEGLTASSHIFLKGLKIGSVEKISYNPDSEKFSIKININDKYHIPKNSTAQIFSTDIMGNKAIRLIFSHETKMAHPGDTLNSGSAPVLTTLIAEELMPLKNKVDTLVSALTVTAEAVNHIMNAESQANLIAGIASLRHTLYNVQQLTATLNSERQTIKNMVNNADTFITALQKSSDDIHRTMANLAQLTDSLKSSEINSTIAGLNAVLKQANNPEGSVGQLLHNDDLYNNLNRTIGQLDSLITAIRANPKKYIKITVF